MATCDFSNWDERYELTDWDGKIWCITPGEIIEKLLKEEDEYGNYFTSYAELSKVCQTDGFPSSSLRSIAILCIRHETRMLAQGIRNERMPEKSKGNGSEMVESVEQSTSNIHIRDYVKEDGYDEEDLDEDLYMELEDYYKFDGEDENALSFFFNYLINDADNSVKIQLQKFIEILTLNIVFHVNVEYELTNEDYEWSNHWCNELALQVWRIASQSSIDVKGLNLFIEKLYLGVLYERVGPKIVPQEDVDEAIQAEEFYEIEQKNGSEVFWSAWRQAEAMSDEEAEKYLEDKAWQNFIDTVANNLIQDVYPMRTADILKKEDIQKDGKTRELIPGFFLV